MKTTFVTVLVTSLLSVNLAAPAASDADPDIYASRRTVGQTAAAGAEIHIIIADVCTVCNYFGLACIAACIAGGPIDPLCDICAGPAIGACLDCIASNTTKV
ncbi:hypothetical protein V8F33_013618 [Rhypophila sp. PSN 637]